MSHAPLRRVSAACVTVVAAAVLAACSDPGSTGSPSDPTETAESVQSPAASPSESLASDVEKPQRPAAMEKKDAEGAAAAAEYFLSLRSYIMKTGDTAEWEAMSHRTCGYCASGLEQAEAISEHSYAFKGGEISASLSEAYERDALTGIWPLDLATDEAEIRVVDAEGKPIFKSDGSRYMSRVEVGLKGGRWVVIEVVTDPEN